MLGAVVNGVEYPLLSSDAEETEVRVLAEYVGGAFSSFWPSKPPSMDLRVLLRVVEFDIFGRFRPDRGLGIVESEGRVLAFCRLLEMQCSTRKS